MKELKLASLAIEAPIYELDEPTRSLIDAARQATFRSYAPYSKFSVGAAIRLRSGRIVTGSNQENAAYPSGMCAERTAAYYAHSQYPDDPFEAIAIAARSTDGQITPAPISPCGSCRQALLEYEIIARQPVKVIMCGSEKAVIMPSIKSLLPFTFSEFS